MKLKSLDKYNKTAVIVVEGVLKHEAYILPASNVFRALPGIIERFKGISDSHGMHIKIMHQGVPRHLLLHYASEVYDSYNKKGFIMLNKRAIVKYNPVIYPIRNEWIVFLETERKTRHQVKSFKNLENAKDYIKTTSILEMLETWFREGESRELEGLMKRINVPDAAT